MNDSTLRKSVVIPTYRRPEMLARCVASVVAGSCPPDEIVIVGRKGDVGTEEAIASITTLQQPNVKIRSAWVTEPGHIPPIEAGFRIASGDLVAFVDDDETVTPEWLLSIESHFSDPTVGLVGGRVLVPGQAPLKLKGKPGCLSWYGKMWGNLGSVTGQAPIEVDSVMEGNCIWRRSVLASLKFDPILNFDDASMYGLDLSLQAKHHGFRVVYDPRALVYHHVGPRAPELDRQERGPRIYCYCRNYTYVILKHFPLWRQAVFLGWWLGIGDHAAWGIGSFVIDRLSGDWAKKRHVMQALKGKIEGIRLASAGVRNERLSA